jgi:hypothetical protein
VWLEGRFGGETSIIGAGSVEVLEQKKKLCFNPNKEIYRLV